MIKFFKNLFRDENVHKILNNTIVIISLLLFCVITIPKMFNHVPWPDESFAWSLAKDMNFSNFVQILHSEGHFIVWYLVILPFAKLHIFYPHAMLVMNWIFYFCALVIMWMKAPFGNVTKLIITFSWMSLNYFPIVARCYSIGVLGLFTLVSLYKYKTKQPILYSILLVFTAHTSLLATIAVFPLTLLFLYDIYKNISLLNKQRLILSALILGAGIFLWFLPFLHGYDKSGILFETVPDWRRIFDFFQAYHYINLFLFGVCLVLVFLSADKKIRCFITLTFLSFILFFSLIYPVCPQHSIFLFIYLILSYWLSPKLDVNKAVSIVFTMVFAFLMFFNHNYHFNHILNYFDKSQVVEYINTQANKSYFIYNWDNNDVILMLKQEVKAISMYKFCCLSLFDEILPQKAFSYIESQFSQKDKNYSVYIITRKKYNENSILFNNKNGNRNDVRYLTDLHKGN